MSRRAILDAAANVLGTERDHAERRAEALNAALVQVFEHRRSPGLALHKAAATLAAAGVDCPGLAALKESHDGL